MVRIFILGGIAGLALGAYLMIMAPAETGMMDLFFTGMGGAFPVWAFTISVGLLGLVFGSSDKKTADEKGEDQTSDRP